MPFFDDAGGPLRSIALTQVPADGRYFHLNRSIGFREHDGAPTYWAPAHDPANGSGPDNRTDLASVPWLLWNFTASYGRQSAPALIHDHRSAQALKLGKADALAQRFEDDRIFRVGLREQKVPLLRAWLMWAFVSAQRYWAHARARFWSLVGQALLGVAVVYGAILAGTTEPLWLLGILLPAVAALAWMRDAALMRWLTYASVFLAPLILAQLCVLVPYWLAELVTREAIDRPFLDPEPGPIAVPFGKAP